jgi:cation transporter-like permease
VLARRARYINTAITLATISGLMVAVTVVMLFTHALIGVHLAGTIAIVFVAAMLTLTAALFVFLLEVRISIAALRIGIAPDE